MSTAARSRVRGTVVLAMSGNLCLAAAAFVLSFTALRDLAGLAGVPLGQAWLWPLVVDGVILEATISVVALRNGTPSARRFAWLLLICGAGISVVANITHALVIADDRVPALIAGFVASVPPLTLVASTHLTVELIRNAATPTLVDTAAGATEPAEPSPLRTTDTSPDEPVTLPTDRAPEPDGLSRGEQQALARQLAQQTDPKLSRLEIARRVGVHATTVGRWLSAPDRQPPEPVGRAPDGRTDHDS